MHPLVAARAAELAAFLPSDSILVHEVPLLVEIGWSARYDKVVVVATDPEVAVARLVADRGMSSADAWARAHTQASDAERVAVADFVIANNGDVVALEASVGELWAALRLAAGQAAG